MKNKYRLLAGAVASLLILPGQLNAQVTLSDGGSTASIDLTGGTGMNSWTVLNGQNQLQQQWFYYSIGSGQIQAINALGLSSHTATGNTLDAIYGSSTGLSVEVTYSLAGGGANSGNADMTETLSVINGGAAISTLNFYQYSHFNLLGEGNNTVSIIGDPAGGYGSVSQTAGATSISEAIISPYATYAEAAMNGQTLASFANPAGYTLNDNVSATGDVTWAFEWSQPLASGQELDIYKDKNLSIAMVPEPSAFGLIAVGAGLFGYLLRRRS